MLQATADLKPNSHRTYALMRLFDGWGWEEEGFSPGERVEVNTGVHKLRPANIIVVNVAENKQGIQSVDVSYLDGSGERAEAVEMELIEDPADEYSPGDEVQVKSGDMVYRHGTVINFFPGSGWPTNTPGSVDVEYDGWPTNTPEAPTSAISRIKAKPGQVAPD